MTGLIWQGRAWRTRYVFTYTYYNPSKTPASTEPNDYIFFGTKSPRSLVGLRATVYSGLPNGEPAEQSTYPGPKHPSEPSYWLYGSGVMETWFDKEKP